ncbi:MAG: class I SAM-dependent methyltransferase [Cyclobacteriaceae bacterium]
MKQPCRLCQSSEVQCNIISADRRQHCLCERCSLIFTLEQHLPTADEERERYLSHNNSLQNTGYVDFLNLAIQPALSWLQQGMQGLDYGCGPEPVLVSILKQAGISCAYFDPYFFPDLVTDYQYDFIFSTECFEHFFNPGKELQVIDALLKNEGYLIIMTELWTDINRFSTWYYARDISHVAFYNRHTMDYIAERFNYNLIHSDDKRVFIFQKNT